MRQDWALVQHGSKMKVRVEGCDDCGADDEMLASELG